MKQIALVMALLVTTFFMAGCASQCHSPCTQKDAAPCHQDMKGERG